MKNKTEQIFVARVWMCYNGEVLIHTRLCYVLEDSGFWLRQDIREMYDKNSVFLSIEGRQHVIRN